MKESKLKTLTADEILEDVKEIYGADENFDILNTYNSYIEMKQESKLSLGNYNVFITNQSEYDSCEKLVDIIYRLLQAHNIITTSYKYLTANDIRDIKYNHIGPIEEEIIIVDDKKIDCRMSSMLGDIKEIMSKYKEKIFIIINNDNHSKDEIITSLKKYVSWTMNVKKISINDKTNYISQALDENNIKIKDYALVKQIAEKPFWKVQDDVLSLIVNCKKYNIQELNCNILNKKLEYKIKEQKAIIKNKSALEELNSLIGLEEVKKQIYQILNYLKVSKRRGKMPMLHMCFMGNPGTAKTTVARIIGKIFAEMEILSSKETFVEVQRGDLIGEYVGHTAPQTMAKIKEASGGILFIDEAYALVNNSSDKDYGHECISTLLKEMEDKRDNLCVILAGYIDEMENMLKTNPGFESRIQFKINFSDYTEEELYKIFKKFAKEENYKISANIKPLLIEYFKNEKNKENFSNGRCVRNLFEKVKIEQADRIVKTKESNIDTITKADIQNVINRLDIKVIRKSTIGFAV